MCNYKSVSRLIRNGVHPGLRSPPLPTNYMSSRVRTARGCTARGCTCMAPHASTCRPAAASPFAAAVHKIAHVQQLVAPQLVRVRHMWDTVSHVGHRVPHGTCTFRMRGPFHQIAQPNIALVRCDSLMGCCETLRGHGGNCLSHGGNCLSRWQHICTAVVHTICDVAHCMGPWRLAVSHHRGCMQLQFDQFAPRTVLDCAQLSWQTALLAGQTPPVCINGLRHCATHVTPSVPG